MAPRRALMEVQVAERGTVAHPSPGRPSPQDARPSTPAAAGVRHRTGAARRRYGCRSGPCTCITHTCPRVPAPPSRTAWPTCAPCSAFTRIRVAGTTSATGRRGLGGGEASYSAQSLGGRSLTRAGGWGGRVGPEQTWRNGRAGRVEPRWRGAGPRRGRGLYSGTN